MAILIFGPFVALGVGIFCFFTRGVDFVSLGIALVFVLFTGFGITVGYHRYFTHAGFEIKAPWLEKLLAIAGSMSAEGPVFAWVSWHRQHHAHTDKPGDPHSPHLHGEGFVNITKGFLHAHMFWLFNPPIIADAHVRKLRENRAVAKINKQFVWWVIAGFILPMVVGVIVRQSLNYLFIDFLWGGPIRMMFVHQVTWSVNSVCHLWGEQPFDTGDESRNHALVAMLGHGEGWHNNHHAFQRSAKHGLLEGQFDLTWVVIVGLYKLGLIGEPYVPDEHKIAEKLRKKTPPQR